MSHHTKQLRMRIGLRQLIFKFNSGCIDINDFMVERELKIKRKNIT
jgi:hypothetical protein